MDYSLILCIDTSNYAFAIIVSVEPTWSLRILKSRSVYTVHTKLFNKPINWVHPICRISSQTVWDSRPSFKNNFLRQDLDAIKIATQFKV